MHAPIPASRFLPVLLLLLLSHFAKAQLVCPTNVDLESGNTTSWNFYIGYATGTSMLPSLSSTAPISGRHSITSGTGTDYYGGFPVVCPGAGSYSMMLGNSNIGAEVDQARYVVSVPSNVNNYSLIYRYAVVFEDPQHSYYEQPYFRVRAYEQSTGAVINCSYYYYVSQSGLPGFQSSPNAYGVYYKDWTTSSLNLSGQAGKNVVIEFTAADCALGGHMGYGYVDMTCGLFAISNNNCAGTPTSPLTAPAGFKSYKWYNSNYSALVDTTRTITVASTSTPTVYHVILTPYPGYGCTDTLTTSVVSSSLTVNAGADTSVCNSANVPLQASATGNGAPYTYSWLPSAGLSCSSCANPTANPTSTTNYVVTVSDANGCVKSDTVNVKARPSVSVTSHFPACGNVGSVSAAGSWGAPPYTYSWNTSPMQFTANAYSLQAGAYSVTVKDSKNCTATASVSLVQPQPFAASIGSATNVACRSAGTGSATVATANGRAPITYSWNTLPAQSGITASNLAAGTYIATATDADGCSDTAIAVITQPATSFTGVATGVSPSCYGSYNGSVAATASGGNAPYTYSWSTYPVNTAAGVSGLGAGTYYLTLKDANNCQLNTSVTLTQPLPVSTYISGTTPVSCYGSSSGSATVTASGTKPPFTYSWSTFPAQTTATATSLAGGYYSVTVKDSAGCTATNSAYISQPSQLSATVSKTAVSCYGGTNGTATVSASGGTLPYTYSWNTTPVQTGATASGLAAGNYTVTVTDAKGCVTTVSTTITQPASLTASTTQTNVSCYGGANGTAAASVSGGTAPYAYSWNTAPIQYGTTATGLSAGSYSLTVTDAKGCTASAAPISIVHPAQLSATAVKTDVSCFGGANGSATVTASGGTTPYAYSWNTAPAQTGATATNLGSGPRSVTVTDAKGCTATASITIGQPVALSAMVTKADVLCYGGATGSAGVAASGGTAPYSYAWNTSPVQTGATAQSLAAGSYTVTVTDSKGCTATAGVSIAQPAQLSGSISKTDVSCFGGANGIATVTPSGGKTPYSYAWNTTPAQTTPLASSLAAGAYTVVITDSNGCAKSLYAAIAQPALLTAGSSVTDVSCYGGANGTASVVASGGTTPYSYSWNTVPSQAAATAMSLPAGNYSATVTDAKGCTATASATIAQPALLSLSTTKTAVSCHGLHNGTAAVIVGDGTTPYTYSWNTAPTQTTAIASGLGAGTFAITVTDSKGCTADDSVIIIQPAQLTGSISPSRLACFGDKNGTAAATISGGTPPYAYAWTTSPVQSSVNATGLVAGTYSLSVTDANGCTITLADSVQQPSKVIATAAVTHAQCYGTMGAVSIQPSGGTPPYAYAWNVTPNTNTPNSGPLPAGAYTATITDSAGCALTIPAVIAQPKKLTLTGHVVKQPCKWGSEGALSITVSGGTAPYAYVWNTAPAQTAPFVSKLPAGSYRVVVTDSAGCAETAQLSLQSLPINITAESDQSICRGKSATLHAAGGLSYRWWPNVALSCLACTDPVAAPAQTTGYFVVGTDVNGCSDTAHALITVIQHEPVSVGPAQDICAGGVAGLSAQGGKSYLWMPADGLDNPASATPQAGPLTASRTYKVVIGNNACFSDTLSQTVNVRPLPRVQLGPDFRGIPGAGIGLEAKSDGADRIAWTPSTSLSCADCFTPTATLGGNITYVATVSNSWGCTATDTINISVGCDEAAFYMANTFTPNGDGQNDRFFPQGKGVNKVARFAVYDRWGETVFNAANIDVNAPDAGWDGTYKGAMLKPDVYLYVIEAKCADGSPVVVRGDVALIR